jgi:hypothetical protein
VAGHDCEVRGQTRKDSRMLKEKNEGREGQRSRSRVAVKQARQGEAQWCMRIFSLEGEGILVASRRDFNYISPRPAVNPV